MPNQLDPVLQQYYSIAMGQPMAQPMVSPEQINQYNQQAIPVAVPVSEIQNYAPQQQFVQQTPQQQMMQPDPRRIAYNQLIQDRFNEIVNYAGGMENAIKAKALDVFQQKAIKDIQSYYGPPPEIEQPMSELERIQLEKERLALEKARNPQMTELDRVKLEQEKLALEQSQKAIGKVEAERMKAETDKLKAAQENIGLASDVVSTADRLLANENALQWAGGKTGAVLSRFPGEARGIRQQIDQLRDQIGLFGRKAIVGQGQGSISDAEQKMAKEALAQVITEGTDEQLVESLKAVRQKFGGILSRIQSEATGQQPTAQPMSQQAGQPRVRTFVPGKGFQD
jgi:hypothetical protein